MEPENPIAVTRHVFVRFTTDRLRGEGLPKGTEGLTIYRHNDSGTVWRVNARGRHVDADESEFEVVRRWVRPRGVMVPSLNGGWLRIRPIADQRDITALQQQTALERWDREPTSTDFLGYVGVVVPGDAFGFPVLWDSERQRRLIQFLSRPDRITGGFPHRHDLDWPDPEMRIDGLVTTDPNRGRWSRKAAALDITLRDPRDHLRHVSAHLLVPAYSCNEAAESLVDLFPSVTTDDLS